MESLPESPLSDAELDHFRALLAAQRSAILNCCRHLSETVLESPEKSDGDEASSEDPADRAAELREQDLFVNMLDRADTDLREVARALDRIEQRTYGICEDCERPIPVARLEAIPTASLCLSCKARLEAA
ncbi:MAG TPA: TraR/DksA C4-type zinc finger protein [Planctomycetota bacterium]|nr:TraR/DksA C4-type zinc finger protein [Planctomycetota bacterium]